MDQEDEPPDFYEISHRTERPPLAPIRFVSGGILPATTVSAGTTPARRHAATLDQSDASAEEEEPDDEDWNFIGQAEQDDDWHFIGQA